MRCTGCPFLANRGVKTTRYEKLQEYYQVSDSEREAASKPDPLYKVRQVLDYMSQNFKDFDHPRQYSCIDEAMIANSARFSYKQYLPAMPNQSNED